MSLANELEKLERLRESGSLTEAEFAQAKRSLLNQQSTPSPQGFSNGGLTEQQIFEKTNLWAMLIHFSALAGYAFPVAGFLAPIILWQVQKTELPGIDAHGRVVTNWLLSSLIYAIICGILFIVVIGIPMLIALGILGFVFPIIGGIKARDGEVWKYPLSIPFF